MNHVGTLGVVKFAQLLVLRLEVVGTSVGEGDGAKTKVPWLIGRICYIQLNVLLSQSEF